MEQRPLLPEISPYHLGYLFCESHPPKRVEGYLVFQRIPMPDALADESFYAGMLDCYRDHVIVVKERKVL